MATINDLNKQIETLQAQTDSETDIARQERDKSDEARGNDDINQMRSHLTQAEQHDARALVAQNRIATFRTQTQQMQKQVNVLIQKRDNLIRTHEQELNRINGEIAQLTGDPQ